VLAHHPERHGDDDRRRQRPPGAAVESECGDRQRELHRRQDGHRQKRVASDGVRHRIGDREQPVRLPERRLLEVGGEHLSRRVHPRREKEGPSGPVGDPQHAPGAPVDVAATGSRPGEETESTVEGDRAGGAEGQRGETRREEAEPFPHQPHDGAPSDGGDQGRPDPSVGDERQADGRLDQDCAGVRPRPVGGERREQLVDGVGLPRRRSHHRLCQLIERVALGEVRWRCLESRVDEPQDPEDDAHLMPAHTPRRFPLTGTLPAGRAVGCTGARRVDAAAAVDDRRAERRHLRGRVLVLAGPRRPRSSLPTRIDTS